MFNLKLYSSATKRINRKTFWGFTITLYLFYGLIYYVLATMVDYQSNPNSIGIIFFVRFLFCLVYYPILEKRLHDLNIRGWPIFLVMALTACLAAGINSFILFLQSPMIGLLVVGFIAGLFPGTSGANRYGENSI